MCALEERGGRGGYRVLREREREMRVSECWTEGRRSLCLSVCRWNKRRSEQSRSGTAEGGPGATGARCWHAARASPLRHVQRARPARARGQSLDPDPPPKSARAKCGVTWATWQPCSRPPSRRSIAALPLGGSKYLRRGGHLIHRSPFPPPCTFPARPARPASSDTTRHGDAPLSRSTLALAHHATLSTTTASTTTTTSTTTRTLLDTPIQSFSLSLSRSVIPPSASIAQQPPRIFCPPWRASVRATVTTHQLTTQSPFLT